MKSDVIFIVVILAIVAVGWLTYSKRKPTETPSAQPNESHDTALIRQATQVAEGPTLSKKPETARSPLSCAFVDLETTGLDPQNDRIIEICVFVITEKATSHDGKGTLVNPGRPLTPFIIELTGITDEMLATVPGEECLHEYFDFIGDRPVYAYNAEFDMGFLKAAARRLGRPFNNHAVCIMERVKAEHPNLRSYKLGEVCKAFGLEIDAVGHRAEGDTRRAVFLWNAVNTGKQPDPSAVRLNRNAREYGVYGHYTQDGVLFYIWTARNGEPTAPDSDYVWSEYVEKRLRGQYDVRCLRGGVTFDDAIAIKDEILAEHATTLLNRVNPHRRVLEDRYLEYEKLRSSCTESRIKGKALEASEPAAALKHYQESLAALNTYVTIVFEEGHFGEVTQDLNRQAHGGEAVKILDRISLLLCKEKRYEEANEIAHQVFTAYPRAACSKAAATITKRIAKGVKAHAPEA